jgi:hypothetical protein
MNLPPNEQGRANDPAGSQNGRIIEQAGPLKISDFFALCLADPEHGYYHIREPFGRSGDFITAPEVSQLVRRDDRCVPGPCLAGSRCAGRCPHRRDRTWPRHLDVRRAAGDRQTGARTLPPGQHSHGRDQRTAAHVQRQTLVRIKDRISWHQAFEEIPEGFTLMIANELFDAIPIHQFVKTPKGFANAWSASMNKAACLRDWRRRASTRPCCPWMRRQCARGRNLRACAGALGGHAGCGVQDRARWRHRACHRLRPSGHRFRRYASGRVPA